MGAKHCFVCGQDNPKGLHIHFDKDGDEVVAHYVCEETHAGWPGVQHGGITSALLDEAAAYVPNFMGLTSVTGELNISFKEPIYVGERLELRAKPIRVHRRLIEVESWIVGPEGQVKASARAKMAILNDAKVARLGIDNSELQDMQSETR
ncbi:MAG: PaaI family thioesterase [Alicyclobacillus sp.]|nr:PaaI family thioesterase [Alicyclobacillus sp.]